MNAAIRTVARNVRALRKARGLSVDALARESGVGKATLARVEASQGNPTVETLMSLANALGVSFGELAADETPTVHVLRASEAPVIRGILELRIVDRLHGSPLVEVLDVTFPAGNVRESSPHPPGVIEHVVLTQGRLRLGPVGQEAEIEPSDVMRFPGDVPHSYRALGDEDAKAVVLMAYPTAAERHAGSFE